jgi:hypothetical protein
MPAAAIYGKDKKPLLSWRVAILPFIEQDNLYRRFKLDEPWDSPNNKALIPLMPKVYAPVNGNAKDGKTPYQLFVGPGALFDHALAVPGPVCRGPTLGRIPDGTSNTLLITEAADPVVWTKPDDLPYDAKKPLPRLGQFPEGFYAAMADGSVYFFKKGLDAKVLHALITPAGGEVIDWKAIPATPVNRVRGYPGRTAPVPPKDKDGSVR